MKLLIKKSFKYRIYPTRSQVSNLENQFSMCRHLYNWNLKERIEAYEKDGTTISYNQQQNQLPQLKIERPWYKGVYSQVLQDV
ncbi:helix-turn-helix domain-containing protein, partial [Desulfobacter sp.]|uniref:helix-turn-helix domain-containing protein n=1 Tax=Desulfobacter sp. TaxID=2294 RepID=UPI00338E2551